jgi:hypothetical protein
VIYNIVTLGGEWVVGVVRGRKGAVYFIKRSGWWE